MSMRVRSLSAFFILLVALAARPNHAFSIEPDVMLSFRPHCEAAVSCPDFALRDSETFITNGLRAGDALDFDIVLENPSGRPIQSVQSWLSYNPNILKGTNIRISDAFPLIAPGEQNFAEDGGTVKLGASNVSGGMNDRNILFARVQFTVIKAGGEGEKITFKDYSLLGQDGKTKVLVVEAGRTVNVLKTRPKDLLLYFGNDAPSPFPPSSQTPIPTQIPVPTPIPTPAIPGGNAPLPTTDPSFGAMQPQGLRIMTEGDRVYLIWKELDDRRIVGYNIYYGTVSGRYIQRRTVSTGTTGVTIRNLPAGKRYFFAVAAFNAYGQDTEFSYEAAVTVGDAGSSTAPFAIASESPPVAGSVVGGGNTRPPSGTGMPLMSIGIIGVIAIVASAASSFLRKRQSRIS